MIRFFVLRGSETSAGHSDGEVVVFSNDPTLTRIEKSKVISVIASYDLSTRMMIV